jgi:hypothetical protein
MPVHRLLLILLLTPCLGVGAIWLSEYHKIYLGRQCHKNLKTIEEAKKKFEQQYPGAKPLQYSDIYKLLPSGFPACPWGGTYTNEIDLQACAECSMNGNPKTEPDTPRTNPKQNGFCDLEPEGATRTILTKIWNKILQWTGSKKTPATPETLTNP